MLPIEYEKALKRFEEFELVSSNFYLVEEEIEDQCINHLLRSGYIDLVHSDEENDLRGEPKNRYQRTYLGIGYFRDKRRKWLSDNAGNLITGVFSIISLMLGYILGMLT